jgi:fumarate hydratase subunit beta
MIEIITPISDDALTGLTAGDEVCISGKIYTARDAAHKKITELIKSGEKPPFDFAGQVVFYAGPSPAKPGRPIGSIGPTTSGRMDMYSPLLISKGLKIMIGKGSRSREVVDAIVNFRGIYFAAIGGIAALMAKCVVSAKVIAFDELGTEAVMELEVKNFPAFVAIDSRGRNLYEKNQQENKS